MCAQFKIGAMNISDYLKSIKKTKTELSQELKLSRPTLNQYIELFETGQKIDNERYNIIFDRLFSDECKTRVQFDNEMNSVRFLLERDRKYDIGNLRPEAADIVARIHNKLVYDMSDNKWNKKVYDSILIILSSYRSNAVIRELTGYISDLNSGSDISDLSDESKAYYSYYYKCFREIKDDTPKMDEEEFKLFLKRREKLKLEREQNRDAKARNIQDKLKKILEEVESEYKDKSIDVSEDEMMAEVLRRMKR